MKDIFITNSEVQLLITVAFVFAILFVISFYRVIVLKSKIDELKNNILSTEDINTMLNKENTNLKNKFEKMLLTHKENLKSLDDMYNKAASELKQLNLMTCFEIYNLLSKRRTRGIYTTRIPDVGFGIPISMHKYVIKKIHDREGYVVFVPLFIAGIV